MLTEGGASVSSCVLFGAIASQGIHLKDTSLYPTSLLSTLPPPPPPFLLKTLLTVYHL